MAIPSPVRTAWSGEGFPRSLRKAGCCSWHVKKLVWQFSNRAGLLTSNHPPPDYRPLKVRGQIFVFVTPALTHSQSSNVCGEPIPCLL